jgi:hypothetical protein
MGDERKLHKVLVGMPEGKSLREIGLGVVDWI